MAKGYSGYYKNVYLRSSYEYAFAMYLDSKSVTWAYEAKEYELDNVTYIPGFFIYDDKGETVRVVEVKSSLPKELKKAEYRKQAMKNLYNIDVEIITYKDLLKIYRKDMDISLNSVITKWLNDNREATPT